MKAFCFTFKFLYVLPLYTYQAFDDFYVFFVYLWKPFYLGIGNVNKYHWVEILNVLGPSHIRSLYLPFLPYKSFLTFPYGKRNNNLNASYFLKPRTHFILFPHFLYRKDIWWQFLLGKGKNKLSIWPGPYSTSLCLLHKFSFNVWDVYPKLLNTIS